MALPLAEWRFFNDPDKGHENRMCWLYIEILKVSVQDAVKGINAGIVDPVTLDAIYAPMKEDMLDWQSGAAFLKSKACANLCEYLNAWSEGTLKITPETFVRIVKQTIKQTKRNEQRIR
jgi:hypothetical protein